MCVCVLTLVLWLGFWAFGCVCWYRHAMFVCPSDRHFSMRLFFTASTVKAIPGSHLWNPCHHYHCQAISHAPVRCSWPPQFMSLLQMRANWVRQTHNRGLDFWLTKKLNRRLAGDRRQQYGLGSLPLSSGRTQVQAPNWLG